MFEVFEQLFFCAKTDFAIFAEVVQSNATSARDTRLLAVFDWWLASPSLF